MSSFSRIPDVVEEGRLLGESSDNSNHRSSRYPDCRSSKHRHRDSSHESYLKGRGHDQDRKSHHRSSNYDRGDSGRYSHKDHHHSRSSVTSQESRSSSHSRSSRQEHSSHRERHSSSRDHRSSASSRRYNDENGKQTTRNDNGDNRHAKENISRHSERSQTKHSYENIDVPAPTKTKKEHSYVNAPRLKDHSYENVSQSPNERKQRKQAGSWVVPSNQTEYSSQSHTMPRFTPGIFLIT